MNSNDIAPENAKERQAKVCPYLGLNQDPQTSLAFPSASNLCYHAKPLAAPSAEYQRSFCLNGRQHTRCPVFTRSELAPLPPEISGSGAHQSHFGRSIAIALIGLVVLVLLVIGGMWLFNGHLGGNGSLSSQPASPTSPSGENSLATATFLVTEIAITPNVDVSAIPNTVTPVTTPSETQTALPSQTPTSILLTPLTPLPVHTLVPCGSPNTWVIYIVRPGDSLYYISQVYGVTVAELQRANCLGTSTTLRTGQTLYVPPWAPIVPTSTPIVVVMPTSTSLPTNTMVFIPPTDTATQPPVATATEPPVATATEPPVATAVPTDTPVSP
jgi:LysM repeat protein